MRKELTPEQIIKIHQEVIMLNSKLLEANADKIFIDILVRTLKGKPVILEIKECFICKDYFVPYTKKEIYCSDSRAFHLFV